MSLTALRDVGFPLRGVAGPESLLGLDARRGMATEDGQMTDPSQDREGLAWQTGVWNRIADIYLREIDQRFAPVVEALIGRAGLRPGEQVLDLGTGTGAVAKRAASIVGASGYVWGWILALKCSVSRGTAPLAWVFAISSFSRDEQKPFPPKTLGSMSCWPASV